MPSITFHCDPELYGVIPEPYPAVKEVPEWLKNMAPLTRTSSPNEFPTETVKRCLPILDAYSAGYIIPLAHPVRVVVDGGSVTTSWRPGVTTPLVTSHSQEQVGDSGWSPALKWSNPWEVRLPKGYSAIYTAPFNQKDPLFQCLTGVVDSDNYRNTINFPFVWTGPDQYDDILPAGIPLVQVIPFRRESWDSVSAPSTESEIKEREKTRLRVLSRFGGYKDKSRSRKTWR